MDHGERQKLRAAVVTGASRGLGRLFALALAAQKRPLVLVARNAERLAQVQREASAHSSAPVHVVAADLAAGDGRAALYRACETLQVDLLINNAGFGMGGPFAQQDVARLAQMLRLNVEGLTELTHHFVPKLQATHGTLVQLSSQAAFQPVPYMAAYAASKAYVLHFSEALGRELQASGVRVVTVCPSTTKTDFFAEAGIDTAKLRLPLADPADVVVATMRALVQGSPDVVVPGLQNKLSAVAARLLPRGWAARIAESAVWRR